MKKAALTIIVVGVSLSFLSKAGSVNPKEVHYGTFGNVATKHFAGLGDCEFVADANLVQRLFPGAKISTAQVEADSAAWDQALTDYNPGDADLSPTDLMVTRGYAGHTITSYTALQLDQADPAPISTITQAAKSGGVWATVAIPQGIVRLIPSGKVANHAVAMIAANAKGPVVVLWGKVTQESWAWWSSVGVQAYAYTWR